MLPVGRLVPLSPFTTGEVALEVMKSLAQAVEHSCFSVNHSGIILLSAEYRSSSGAYHSYLKSQ